MPAGESSEAKIPPNSVDEDADPGQTGQTTEEAASVGNSESVGNARSATVRIDGRDVPVSELLQRSRYTRPFFPAEPAEPEQPAGNAGNGDVGTWAEEGPRERGKGGAPRETMRVVPVFIPVVVPVDRSGRKEGEKGRKGKAR